jgi:hypothetical protein
VCIELTNQRTRIDRDDGSDWVYQYAMLGRVIAGIRLRVDAKEVAGPKVDCTVDTIANHRNTGGMCVGGVDLQGKPAQPVVLSASRRAPGVLGYRMMAEHCGEMARIRRRQMKMTER